MLDVTRHNWEQLEQRFRSENSEWLRSLSVDDKMAILLDLHCLAATLNADPRTRGRLAGRRWREKIAIRRKMVAAWQYLDEHDERRAAGTNAD